VTLQGARADHLRAVIDKLNEAGVAMERRGANLLVRRNGRLKAADGDDAALFPVFRRTCRRKMMSLLALAPGISIHHGTDF